MIQTQPKALFYNIPGHGHVNPSLPLVEELVRRGHDIHYFITPDYRPAVEAAGAVFRNTTGMSDDYFGGPNMDGTRPFFAAYSLWSTTAQILPALIEEARGEKADYILFDQMCPWGYFIAGILGLPSVASLSLMPLGTPPLSAIKDPYFRDMLFSVMREGLSDGIKAMTITRNLSKKYLLRPTAFSELLNLTGDVSLAYTFKEFPLFLNGISSSVRFVGRTLPEDPAADPALFECVKGRPLVYISLGSLVNRNRDFYTRCIEAFSGEDVYVMITTGHGVDPAELGPLPENVAVHAWLPQLAVLNRAALFISHGGLNSIHDAFYYGVPLLVVPQQNEQALNGSRAVALGAGLMLTGSSVNAENLLACTRQLLRDPTCKETSSRLGEKLRRAGGASTAADEVEALLARPGSDNSNRL